MRDATALYVGDVPGASSSVPGSSGLSGSHGRRNVILLVIPLTLILIVILLIILIGEVHRSFKANRKGGPRAAQQSESEWCLAYARGLLSTGVPTICP
jgi:hypothetical protein